MAHLLHFPGTKSPRLQIDALHTVLTDTTVSEVKNVARQSFTLQLRDSLSYARSTGRSFDLYVRPDTYLTGPLRDAIAQGDINLRLIP